MNFAVLERLAYELPCPWLLILLLRQEEENELIWAEFTIAKLALQLALRTPTTEQQKAPEPTAEPGWKASVREQLERSRHMLNESYILLRSSRPDTFFGKERWRGHLYVAK